MRKFMNILREAEFDFGIQPSIEDYDPPDDEEAKPLPKYHFLNSLVKYKALKHDARQADRSKWREKQKNRFHNDMRDDEESEYMSKRSVQKSLVGYKPFKFPLIRFGKFKERSRNFLDPEMRAEMGGVTHEAGVSCYMGYPFKDGYTFDSPHPDRASYDINDSISHRLFSMREAIWYYLNDGKPMDIFLIHGHLVSFGANGQENLTLGADGEYLLDTRKPFNQETLPPEKIYIGKQNLTQYTLSQTKGIDGLRDYVQSEDD